MTEDSLPNGSLPDWRDAFRRGVAFVLTDDHLVSLGRALLDDDPRLLQGRTTDPPPGTGVPDWPVHAACVLAWCGWQVEGLVTVRQVEEYFAYLCSRIDQALGESAACRWFINAVDDLPRAEMRRGLLEEIEAEQARRLVTRLTRGGTWI